MKRPSVHFMVFVLELFLMAQVKMSDQTNNKTLSDKKTRVQLRYMPDIFPNFSGHSSLRFSYPLDSSTSVTSVPTESKTGLSTVESSGSLKGWDNWTRSTFEDSKSQNLINDSTLFTYHTNNMNSLFNSLPSPPQPPQYQEASSPQDKRDQPILDVLGDNPISTPILLNDKNKPLPFSLIPSISISSVNNSTAVNPTHLMPLTISPTLNINITTPILPEYKNQSTSSHSNNNSTTVATLAPSIPLYIHIYTNQTTNRKCCPRGMLLDRDTLSCQNKTLFNITEWNDDFVNNLALQITDQSILNDFTWRSKSDPNTPCLFDTEDGSMFKVSQERSFLVEFSCIENIHESNLSTDKNRTFLDIFTCVTLNFKRNYLLMKCMHDFCRQKCCRMDQILNAEKMICEDTSSYNLEPFYHHELGTINVSNPSRFAYYVQRSQLWDSNPCVFIRKDRYISLEDESYVFGDKKYHMHTNGTRIIYMDFSCTDVLLNGTDITSDIMACYTLDKLQLTQVINHSNSYLDFWVHIVNLISTGSIVCLVLLVVLSPTKLTLHTKITISLCVAMILKDIFWESTRFLHLSTSGCVARGLLLDYIRQTISFWVSVMCYEITRIIRGSGKLRPLTQLTESKSLYPTYGAFAWGVPCFNAMILILLAHAPPRFLPDPKTTINLRPKIECFGIELFSTPKWIFLDIPQLFLFLVNVILLSHSGFLLHYRNESYLCCRGRQQHPSVRVRSNQTQDYAKMYQERLLIYCVLLITRILFLVVSQHNNNISLFIMYMLLLIASTRGFVLFLIVAATRNWSLIREVLGRMRGLRTQLKKLSRASPYKQDKRVEQTRF